MTWAAIRASEELAHEPAATTSLTTECEKSRKPPLAKLKGPTNVGVALVQLCLQLPDDFALRFDELLPPVDWRRATGEKVAAAD